MLSRAESGSRGEAHCFRSAGQLVTRVSGSVMGKNASDFTLPPSSNCGSSLSAGTGCTISVTFTPAAKGSLSATLNVTDNARSGTQTVLLSGTGD